MIFINFILSLLIVTQTVKCLNQNDFCSSSKGNCERINNNTIRCLNNECDSKSEWNINCADSYCSKEALSCEIFKSWQDKVDEKRKSVNWKDKLTIRNYQKFKANINKCPVNEIFEFKLSNVCRNDLRCHLKKSPSECNCNKSGRLAYKCNDFFCVSDEQTCIRFKSLLSGIYTLKDSNKLKLSKCRSK
jgi:hypothetical protein